MIPQPLHAAPRFCSHFLLSPPLETTAFKRRLQEWIGPLPETMIPSNWHCNTSAGQITPVQNTQGLCLWDLWVGLGSLQCLAEVFCLSCLYLQSSPIMEIFWLVADRRPEIIIWKWKKMLPVKALEIYIVSLAANWNILDQMYPMHHLFKL